MKNIDYLILFLSNRDFETLVNKKNKTQIRQALTLKKYKTSLKSRSHTIFTTHYEFTSDQKNVFLKIFVLPPIVRNSKC